MQGLIVVQPDSQLYDTYGLVAANGVVQVEAGTPFRLFLAIFCRFPVRVHRSQVVAQALPRPTTAVPSYLTIGKVLGLMENTAPATGSVQPKKKDVVDNTTRPTPRQAASSKVDIPGVDGLDWSHLYPSAAKCFKKMLSKYFRMLDGSLGEFTTVEHHIE